MYYVQNVHKVNELYLHELYLQMYNTVSLHNNGFHTGPAHDVISLQPMNTTIIIF